MHLQIKQIYVQNRNSNSYFGTQNVCYSFGITLVHSCSQIDLFLQIDIFLFCSSVTETQQWTINCVCVSPTASRFRSM